MQTISEIKLGPTFSQQYLMTNVAVVGRGGGRSEIHDCIQAVKGTPLTSAVPLTLKIVREGIMIHLSHYTTTPLHPLFLLTVPVAG